MRAPHDRPEVKTGPDDVASVLQAALALAYSRVNRPSLAALCKRAHELASELSAELAESIKPEVKP